MRKSADVVGLAEGDVPLCVDDGRRYPAQGMYDCLRNEGSASFLLSLSTAAKHMGGLEWRRSGC